MLRLYAVDSGQSLQDCKRVKSHNNWENQIGVSVLIEGNKVTVTSPKSITE